MKCKNCGTTKNLRVDKIGRKYRQCKNCFSKRVSESQKNIPQELKNEIAKKKKLAWAKKTKKEKHERAMRIVKATKEKYGDDYYQRLAVERFRGNATDAELKKRYKRNVKNREKKFGKDWYRMGWATKDPVRKKEIIDKGVKTRRKFSKKKKAEIYSKRHETMKKNKRYGKSLIEDECYNFLLENLDENLKRQIRIKNHALDFYSPKYNIYIQFDGVYWHGYKRINGKYSLTEKKTKKELLKTKQGIKIWETMQRDKEKDKLFKNLIRIYDTEFYKNKNNVLIKIKKQIKEVNKYAK